MRSALWYVFRPKDSVKTLAEMTDEEKKKKKNSHISAKELFIKWYKKNYLNSKRLIKDLNK